MPARTGSKLELAPAGRLARTPMRKLMHILAGLLMLIAGLMLVLTVRGLWVEDYIVRTYNHASDRSVRDRVILGSGNGVIFFSRVIWRTRLPLDPIQNPGLHDPINYVEWEFLQVAPNSHRAFSWQPDINYMRRGDDISGTTNLVIGMPHWLILLVCAGLGTVWFGFIARRARWMRNAGFACRGCGYDLRATQDRCPECGRVPAYNEMPKVAPVEATK